MWIDQAIYLAEASINAVKLHCIECNEIDRI